MAEESSDGNHHDGIYEFPALWQEATADGDLALYGFRRFKTTHLLNLRFLENEIAELDHQIYQAGLSLNLSVSKNDRLGLKHSKKDEDLPEIHGNVNRDLVWRLRDLLKQYGLCPRRLSRIQLTNSAMVDEAILAFNNIMAMETFSSLDNAKRSRAQNGLNLYEMYKTRLIRVDMESRSRVDPFQRQIRKHLRAFRYWRLSQRLQNRAEILEASDDDYKWSYQNTTLLASTLSRLVAMIITCVFLIVPLAILAQERSQARQLVFVTVFILAFAFLVATLLKASNLEMMVVSAAYAAVLSVFFSNVTV